MKLSFQFWSFLILCFLALAKNVKSDELQCFTPGQCVKSFQVASTRAEDEFDCLETCQSEETCTWFTFFKQNSLCQLFANCSSLDSTFCSDCISGQKECTQPEPVCWVVGECHGEVVHLEDSETKEQCLELCKSTTGCRWFTFLSEFLSCMMYSDCNTIDERCTTCISGEKRCEIKEKEHFVALVVGGQNNGSVEVISPEGKCQHRLADIPLGLYQKFFHIPVLAFIDGKILACAGDTDFTGGSDKECWIYYPKDNFWTTYSKATYSHGDYFGAVYQDKIFLTDAENPEVFDPLNDTWSQWPVPKKPSGGNQCCLTWEDTFLLIGGGYNKRGVQSFNHSTQTWTILDESSGPMDVHYSGCTVLPNQNVVVLGSLSSSYSYSSALYNVRDNKWTYLGDTKYSRIGTTVVRLGERVFAIGGLEADVIEEFIPENNTWVPMEGKLIVPRVYHSTLAVPDHLFAHLDGGCIGVN